MYAYFWEESKDIINELRKLEKSVKIDNKRIEELKSDINNKINEQSEIVFDNNKKHIVPSDLKIGDLVKIVSLNKDGNVLEINGNSITVQAGNMKVNIDKSNLKSIKNIKKEKVKIEYKKEPSKVVKNIKSKMDIRGMNVDEATLVLDNYLDDVYMSSLNEIRIIHGKGTGALRKGVREFLETHYHVKKIREGEYNEGGSGVTVVTLK